jgi:hypothetical protein
MGMAVLAAECNDDTGPATLHRVMQTMIGEGLRHRYEPPQRLSHELFVLLMQIKENEQQKRGVRRSARREAEAAKSHASGSAL